MYAGPNDLWISSDKQTRLSWDGTTLTLYAAGTAVGSWTAAGGQVFPVGGQLGDSAADLVGFWGATPAAQPAATAQSALATTTINAVGSTTLTAADLTTLNSIGTRVTAATVLINQMRSDLVTMGLLKGSN